MLNCELVAGALRGVGNISAYESGRRTPTVRTLVALLDACDVELSWRARNG